MKILLDTNVLLDYLTKREPFAGYAQKIVDLCRKEILTGAVAAQSISDIFYILRKDMSLL